MFRVVKCSDVTFAATSCAVTLLRSHDHDVLSSEDLTALISKRKCFSNWAEGSMQLM